MTSESTSGVEKNRQAPKSNVHISTLSMELIAIPENEQGFIFEYFEEALRKNLIAALPDESQTFEATYIDLTGKQVKEHKREEHIVVNDAWEKWVAEQREKCKYHVMKVTGDFSTTADRITANPDEFELMLKLRREELIKRERETKTEAPGAVTTAAKVSTAASGKKKRKSRSKSPAPLQSRPKHRTLKRAVPRLKPRRKLKRSPWPDRNAPVPIITSPAGTPTSGVPVLLNHSG